MQQKLSAAETEVERMLLPGAHSTGPGEDKENLPVWVELFRKYFEVKKSVVSKLVRQEQFHTALRTMRNTLIPPANSPPTSISATNNGRNVRQRLGSSYHNDNAGHVMMGSTIGTFP